MKVVRIVAEEPDRRHSSIRPPRSRRNQSAVFPGVYARLGESARDVLALNQDEIARSGESRANSRGNTACFGRLALPRRGSI